MNRSVLFSGLILAAMTSAAIATEWKEIRFVSEGAYPPFNFISADGTLKGFDIDIANALCEKMNVKCKIAAQDWDGLIPGLQAGKFDAVIASMSITEERKRQVDFTDRYYSTPLTIAVPKDSPIKNTNADNFNGKTVGVQSGTTQAFYAEDVLAKSGAAVQSYVTNDEASADLSSGRLDALISDKYPIVSWLQTDAGNCCHILEDIPYTRAYIGIAIKKGNDDLKEQLNTAIEAIRKNGTYDKIMRKYFNFDIY